METLFFLHGPQMYVQSHTNCSVQLHARETDPCVYSTQGSGRDILWIHDTFTMKNKPKMSHYPLLLIPILDALILMMLSLNDKICMLCAINLKGRFPWNRCTKEMVRQARPYQMLVLY